MSLRKKRGSLYEPVVRFEGNQITVTSASSTVAIPHSASSILRYNKSERDRRALLLGESSAKYTKTPNSAQVIKTFVNGTEAQFMRAHKEILARFDKSDEDHLRLENEIKALREEVATKDDIISSQEVMLSEMEAAKQSTEDKVIQLKDALDEFLPHKRTFKVSLYFFLLFAGCFISTMLTGVRIIEPFWNFLGLLLSSGFILLGFALRKDWNKVRKDLK